MGEQKDVVLQGQLLEVFAPVDGWSQIAAGEWRGMWVKESWLCQLGTP